MTAHAITPEPAAAAITPALVARLRRIVGEKRVLTRESELRPYESDGLPSYHKRPAVAVFPGTREEVVEVVRALAAEGVPFVPRGAGTGLSGGALTDGVVLLGLQRLKRIIDVDPASRVATVEPGVVNSVLGRTVAPHELHFAPDPSSQAVCTIGGNVAENAGGPHCLKYGVTLNHILACTVVLPDGEIVQLGSPTGESDGYDLLGAFVGSEGCFGVALDVTVKLSRDAQAVRTLLADFASMEEAARAVSAIIASGVVPAAMEMMDNPTIRAVEASIYAAGYPVDAGGVLLIELDGLAAGLDADVERVHRHCHEAGARTIRVAADAADRARLWQGRKKAFGAMGRLSPHLVVQDAVVPRTKLPEILQRIQEIGSRYDLRVCNVFHAGDGNIHPNIPYDAGNADETHRVHQAMSDIMDACIAAGGTITGEHGVGLDKIGYMERLFPAGALQAMCDLRAVFDPERRANPGKVVPVRSCREWSGVKSTWDGALSARARRQDAADLAPSGAAAARPSALRTPLSPATERVLDAVRDARARRTPLRIVGAGTWLDAQRPVVGDVHVLRAGELAGIVDYVPGDLTLTALGGTSLAEIERVTAAEGQFLALDPFGAPQGTLGATIATASAGPLAGMFGTPRDNVLGIDFVTGSGLAARGGGRVVKNVAGFDLVRLLVGSWGSLGVLTEITVRLRARPEEDRTLVLSLPRDAGAAERLIERARTAPLAAWALELVNAPLARQLGIGDHPALLARLAGNADVVAAQRRTLAELGAVAEVPGTVWERLRAAEPADAAVARYSAPLAAIASCWRETEQRLAPFDDALVHATLHRGVVRAIIPSAAARENDLMRLVVTGLGQPHRVFERLPAPLWALLRGTTAGDRLSRGVKHAFDPLGVLNPGILGS